MRNRFWLLPKTPFCIGFISHNHKSNMSNANPSRNGKINRRLFTHYWWCFLYLHFCNLLPSDKVGWKNLLPLWCTDYIFSMAINTQAKCLIRQKSRLNISSPYFLLLLLFGAVDIRQLARLIASKYYKHYYNIGQVA